ncbi:ABC transporter permease [Oleiagrimonas sp. C23AA]|uniref:ABC transporter permease n=1 Tax=Oleiagrimonas sp. C23AA TaxID=2719047 RepID=UPI0014238E16|nr:ABC transporter permease [Oleiagrimonas sp. C23AA]NII12025.1 FtsX-like permease family protein [Oleiagrimonas sp. C23AA]
MLTYYLSLAWQRAIKGPWITGLIVLTMAVGIAACMTALTVSRALSGEPLPGVSEHLYIASVDACADPTCSSSNRSKPSLLGLDDAREVVDKAPVRVAAAVAQAQVTLSTSDDQRGGVSERGLIAYGRPLALLGLPMRLGRGWTAAEEASAAPVMVIDVWLARQLFGQADVLGRTVTIGGHGFRVIGVSAPRTPRIQFLDVARNNDITGVAQHFYLPVTAALAAGIGPTDSGICAGGTSRKTFGSTMLAHCVWLNVWARVPDVSARDRYARWWRAFVIDHQHDGRYDNKTPGRLYRASRWTKLNNVVPPQVGMNTLIAFGLLALCMINVAGLLAARFLRRQGDIGVRRALGAPRQSIFAQHVIESLGLGLIAGLLGWPLTWLGLWIVRMQPVGYADRAHMHPATFAWLLGMAALVGVTVGIMPAWRMCLLSPALQIKRT